MLGRREGALPAGSAYVVRFMVVNALGPGLLALLAVVLDELGVPRPGLWRVCSAVYLGAALLTGLVSRRQEREIAAREELVFPAPVQRGLWGVTFLAHAVQGVNLVGYPWAPSGGLLLLGLWLLLALAAAQFVLLLFLALR